MQDRPLHDGRPNSEVVVTSGCGGWNSPADPGVVSVVAAACGFPKQQTCIARASDRQQPAGQGTDGKEHREHGGKENEDHSRRRGRGRGKG